MIPSEAEANFYAVSSPKNSGGRRRRKNNEAGGEAVKAAAAFCLPCVTTGLANPLSTKEFLFFFPRRGFGGLRFVGLSLFRTHMHLPCTLRRPYITQNGRLNARAERERERERTRSLKVSIPSYSLGRRRDRIWFLLLLLRAFCVCVRRRSRKSRLGFHSLSLSLSLSLSFSLSLLYECLTTYRQRTGIVLYVPHNHMQKSFLIILKDTAGHILHLIVATHVTRTI